MKIFFWKGVIVPPDIEARCGEELKQLSLGQYKSLALEKLAVSGEKIYSIRVNRADRLILAEHEGILIVLQYVDNHAYDKSKFLEKGGLRRYLTSKHANLDEVIAAGFKAIENEEAFASIAGQGDKEVGPWQAIERHDGRWIQLTEKQREGFCVQLPAIIKGHAGAGKSTLALSMLLNDLQHQEADTPRLYLSKSPTLVSEMHKRWQGMGLEEDSWQDKVLFLTYRELLQRFFIGPNVGPDITSVMPEDFYAWMGKYIKKNPWTPPQENVHAKPNGAATLSTEELSLLWEEVQKCAGLETVEKYYALGQRQSELTDRKNREYVARAYQHYIEYLTSAHQISPELFVAKVAIKPFFSLMMIDEAQNLSPAELAVVQQLAINNNIIFFAGDQQVLNSRRPNLPYIRARYHEQGTQITEFNLHQTHRCPKRVVQLVNELTRLKRLVAGGIADKHEQENMEAVDGAIEGEVVWSTIEDMNLSLLQKRAQHTDFAVVTTANHREAIRQLFPAGVVVFSADEAQGLDIPDLLVFNVFDEGICHPIASVLESKAKKQHRAKAGQEDFSHNRQFDALITMVTRAECSLTLVNDDKLSSKSQKNVIRYLSQLMHTRSAAVSEPAVVKPASSDNDWEARATQYLRSGHTDQAQQIWVDILHRSKDSFSKFQTQVLPTEQEVLAKIPAEKKAPEASPSIETIHHPKITVAEASVLTKAPTAPSSKSLSRQDPKKGKAEAYVKGLIKVFNLQNMTALIKHSQFIKLLFETSCEPNDCLLAHILSTPHCIPPFQAALNMHPKEAGKIISYVNAQNLTSGIGFFFDFTQTALLEALVLNPKICCEVTPESLMTLNGHILDRLASYNGADILKGLFHNNPQLCLSVTAEALCLAHPACTADAMRSPLYSLVSSCGGLDVLSILLHRNPQLYQGITAEALCLALPESTDDGLTSPLYWLAGRYPEMLKALFDANPGLYQGITAKALCLARSENASAGALMSPLCLLSGSQIGQEILLNLLDKNPLLCNSITTIACLASDKVNSPTSSLYWLSGSTEGQLILNKLLSNNAQLCQDITAADLCVTNTEDDGSECPTTPLYWLSSTKEGLVILTTLFCNNPELRKDITAEALCLPIPINTGGHLQQSPLYWLSRSHEGVQVLNLLLQDNPKLSQNITAKALCLIQYKYESPLYLLATSMDGLHILDTLLHHNPRLSQGITAKALCLAAPASTKEYINESPLYLLTCRPKGVAILKTIVEGNPALSHAIEEKYLKCPVKILTDDDKQLTKGSCWTNLMRSLEGQKILLLLHKPLQGFFLQWSQQKTKEDGSQNPAPFGFHP